MKKHPLKKAMTQLPDLPLTKNQIKKIKGGTGDTASGDKDEDIVIVDIITP